MNYAADLETTTDINDCRVWAWGVCDTENYSFEWGTDLSQFFGWCVKNTGSTLYFHNLKFDGEFLIHYLLNHDFTHITQKYDIASRTFETLITDMGVYYSIKIYFEVKGKRRITVTILDSLKIIPLSVEQTAKAFNLGMDKLEIDYDKKRDKGYIPDKEEIDYLSNDVGIMARAISQLHAEKLTKMTTASNAMHDYKNIICGKYFDKWYPSPEYDKDVRLAYKGGYTYLNPKYRNMEVNGGLVFDVNSLYPSVMYNCYMPYGEAIYFEGEYEPDESYPLYIQALSCEFSVKKGYIPTIQLKGNFRFMPNEYIEESNGEVTLCLTSVDMKLFTKHYYVYNIEYHGGWKFRQSNKMFTKYIDKWIKVKNDATIAKNGGMRTIAKLMLNSLYGKFALNPNVQSKIPYLDKESGRVRYFLGEKGTRKPIYSPVAIFITAHARHKTITTAQQLFDRFIYADTDSLHLIGTEMPDIPIDNVKLGEWKHEATFTKAKYVRQKTYIEEIDGELNVVCAGMPHKLHKDVTFDNFEEGASYDGKLVPKHVDGGIVLESTQFTIKRLDKTNKKC